ncbi:MAG: hypothetical protein ACR2FU_06340 [Streptosporangiaceae bacterium]
METISDSWGWYFPRNGKIVWAIVQDLLHPMQHSAVPEEPADFLDGGAERP